MYQATTPSRHKVVHPDIPIAAPHGGVLVELPADPEAVACAARSRAPAWTLTPEQLCDLELLASGAFSPLTGFLGPEDYMSVCTRMRLRNGLLWPIPVVLEIPESLGDSLRVGDELKLCGADGRLLAVQTVEQKWRRDRLVEAQSVLATRDLDHPGVAGLMSAPPGVCISGRLQMVGAVEHADFPHLRHSPRALRSRFASDGHERVVAFQTRNPMHRAHLEITRRAAEQSQAHLLLHPVVGLTKPGDVDYRVRVQCYEALLPSYPAGAVTLALLPLAMRMAGPREALWHAIIRKNYGATHFIVGRDHAGPGRDRGGRPFYEPEAAQHLVTRHQEELGITVLAFPHLVYVVELEQFVPETEVPPGARALVISGTEQRRRLSRGEPLPSWLTPAPVAAALASAAGMAGAPSAAGGR